jgi:hypothetical protein
VVNALTMAAIERAAEDLAGGRLTHALRHHPGKDQAVSDTASRTRWRYRDLTHVHSLHFDALVVTSAPIPARLCTGPGQGEVAQLVEHAAENRGVGGPIPPLPTHLTGGR